MKSRCSRRSGAGRAQEPPACARGACADAPRVGRAAPGHPARAGAATRRDRDGRQRPVGQGSAGCRAPPDTSAVSTRCSTSSRAAIEIGVKAVSAYAFSTENWSRSPDEVRFLMGFNRDVIRRRRDEMHELGVRVRWAGRAPRLWRSVIKELQVAEELTRDNDVLTLTMCVNYGGRAELADAARSIAREVAAGRLEPREGRRAHVRPAPLRPRARRRRPGLAYVGGAAAVQLHALAGGVLRARLHRRPVARRRPAGTCGTRSTSTPGATGRYGGAR